MATRRPRIKIRPNLNRARLGNGSSTDESKPNVSTPEEDNVKSEKLDIAPPPPTTKKDSKTNTANSTNCKEESKPPESQRSAPAVASGSDTKSNVDGKSSDPDAKTTATRRQRIKVRPNLSARRTGGLATRSQTQDNTDQPSTDEAGDGSSAGFGGFSVDITNNPDPQLNPPSPQSPSTVPCPVKNEDKLLMDVSDIKHQQSQDTVDLDQTYTTEQTNVVLTESGSAEEIMKSPTRRPRFIRAKPNIVEAERRHQRLSSFSESDDFGAPWKSPLHSEKGTPGSRLASEQKLGDHHMTRDAELSTEHVEKKKQFKSRRRQSVKLEQLVSENRRSFTISDLIHMNPVSNPMKRSVNKDMKKKDKDDRLASSLTSSSDITSPVPSTRSPPGSPHTPDVIIEEDGGGGGDGDDSMPVPQVMLGPDGNIVLNDASLTIKNVSAEPDPTLIERDVVVDNDNYDPSFYYKSRKRSLTWTIKETTKFYVALSCLGTDFSLMEKLFPKRDRGELKRKFKLEEKKHRALVDKALNERLSLDMSLFDTDDDNEEGHGSNDEQENIAETVKGVLETEKKEGIVKRKNLMKPKEDKKIQNNQSSSLVKSKPPTRKTKKRNNGWRSRYYDCSEDDSFEDDKEEPDNKKQHLSDLEEDEFDSDEDDLDETSTLKRIVERKTRSGRQPKRTIPFSLTDERVHRRQQATTPRTTPVPSQEQINPNLAPIICTPPRGVSHRILEDTETGQRILLVKSPPPSTSEDSSDFVHIYLMSPRRNQPNEVSATHQQIDDLDVFIPPPAAVRQPTCVQEEIITEEVKLVNSNSGSHGNQQISHCNRQSEASGVENPPERTTDVRSPAPSVQVTDYRTNPDKDIPTNAEGQMQEVMDIYENAEITTLTNDEGQIIEILIDPGLTNNDQ